MRCRAYILTQAEQRLVAEIKAGGTLQNNPLSTLRGRGDDVPSIAHVKIPKNVGSILLWLIPLLSERENDPWREMDRRACVVGLLVPIKTLLVYHETSDNFPSKSFWWRPC